MLIGLVAPTGTGSGSNPGWHMITAGIRHLLRKSVPGAEFAQIDMIREWTDQQRADAAKCDALVLCGNPRFDLGKSEWLYCGVLSEMLKTGLPVYDFYGGSSTYLGISETAQIEKLHDNKRNEAIAKLLRRCSGVTSRDAVFTQVCAEFGVHARLAPCSSWWAASEFGVTRKGGARKIVIPFRGQDAAMIAKLANGRELVTVNRVDHDWYVKNGIETRLIYDARELLELFAECEEVISFRLHSAIPAASLGCKVLMIAIDTRAAAVDMFSIPRTAFKAQGMPQPALATAPHTPDFGDMFDA